MLSTYELAEKWGVDPSRILRLAREGRIEGASLVGKRWMFPVNAQKPVDGRMKTVRASAERDAYFRFPQFVNFKPEAYSPPLSDEETRLRNAQLAFHACRFDEAKQLLFPLTKAKSRYVRLAALYLSLFLSISEDISVHESLLSHINEELSKDFPHRREMLLLRYNFEAVNNNYKPAIEEFYVQPEYVYHPSAYYTAILASIIPIQNGDFSLMSRLRYETYELLCQQMEREGYFLEAQQLHYLLSVVYQLQYKEENMAAHIRRGLQLAAEHELYFYPALYSGWYPVITRKVLKSFPEDLAEKLLSLDLLIRKNCKYFYASQENYPYADLLSGNELDYAFLANQGYSNREIAAQRGVSEKTVSKMYQQIYDKLGVRNKHELIALINSTHSGSVK